MKRIKVLQITELRNWLVPLLLSLYFVPLPPLGARAIPFLLLGLMLTDPRLRVPRAEAFIYSALIAGGLLITLIQPEKFGFLISFLLAILISRVIELIPRDWSLIPALYIHLGAALVSLLTLMLLEYDLLPQTIYGESRHGIHLNPFLSFRISGIYSEPSTMGVHMLLMSIWANHTHPKNGWVAITYSAMALTTFSSLTVIAAFKVALDLRRLLLSRSGLLMVPVIAFGGGLVFQTFYPFFTEKLSLYNSAGIENAKRVELFFVTRDMISRGEFDIMLGHTTETIESYVIYDLGIMISTPMIIGFVGILIIIAFLIRMRWSLVNIAIVLATKATINNPLLWVVTRRFPKL